MKGLAFSVLGTILVSVPVFAGVVAPSKASQIFMLRPSGGQGACVSAANLQIDEMVSAGVPQPFLIPPGQVFVIESASFQGNGGGPLSSVSRHHALEVLVVQTNVLAIAGGGAMADANGFVSGGLTVEPGVVIKPGQTLCARLTIGNAFVPPLRVRLQGFLAKDK